MIEAMPAPSKGQGARKAYQGFLPPPHPALRATFSHVGEKEGRRSAVSNSDEEGHPVVPAEATGAEPPSPPVGEGARRVDEGGRKGGRLKSLAKAMRRGPTEPEATLWSLLRDRRLVGYKFRRQVPLGPSIADFVYYRSRLIVELDGSQHAESRRDLRRDAELRRRGFKILRIWNNELTANRAGVLDAIWAALHADIAAPSPVPGAEE